MNVRNLLVIAVIVAGVFVLGCKKEEPVAPKSNTMINMTEDATKAAADATNDAEKAAAEAKAAADKAASDVKAEADKAAAEAKAAADKALAK